MSKIATFLREWPEAEFGPAHVILSDGNLDDEYLNWSLAMIGTLLDGTPWPDTTLSPNLYEDCDRDELAATRTFLHELLTLSIEAREADYESWSI